MCRLLGVRRAFLRHFERRLGRCIKFVIWISVLGPAVESFVFDVAVVERPVEEIGQILSEELQNFVSNTDRVLLTELDFGWKAASACRKVERRGHEEVSERKG